MQKCESTSHGITAPDVLLEKKPQKYVKSKQKISPFEKFVAKYVFFEFFKISIWDIHKKQTLNHYIAISLIGVDFV